MSSNIANDYGASMVPATVPPGQGLGIHLSNFFGGPSGSDTLAQNLPQDVSAESVLGEQQPEATPAADAGMQGELGAIDNASGRLGGLDAQLVASDKRNRADSDRLRDETKNAGDLSIAAAEEKQRIERPLLDQLHADLNDLNERTARTQAIAQQQTDEQMKRWDAARTDAANGQLHDFFSDLSVSGKIVGMISAALGGFANGLAGQPGAPTALDRIIQRDMEMQIQNLNQKNRVADKEEGKLRVLMDQGLNQLQAQQAMRAAINDKVKVIALDVANRTGTADAKAAAAKIAAERDADTQRLYQQSQSATFQDRTALAAKQTDLEIAASRLTASIAKGAVAAGQKDSLAADVDGFQGSPIERAALSRQVSALKQLYGLSQDSDNSYDPVANANRRTGMQNALGEINSNGTPAARGAAVGQAVEEVGGRYSGLLTDTHGRRAQNLKDAAEKVRNSLGTGKAKGEFAALLDKIDALK